MIDCHICKEEHNPVKETEKNCVGCGNPAQDPTSRWYGWTKAELVAKIEKLEQENKDLALELMVSRAPYLE